MSQNRIEWLRLKVFPEAVQARSFGADGKKFVRFEPSNKRATDQFCSDVVFGDVTIEKEDGQLVTESVVIKFQPSLEMTRKATDCDVMFNNEILFYSELIPQFRKYDTDNVLSTSFCEFVHGKATNGQDPDEDVIILKNLYAKGFQLTDEKLFIDEKHVKLALDRIAKYHALSLKFQIDDPVGFQKFVSKIKNPQIKLDEEMFPRNVLTRGIDPLKNEPKYKDRLRGIYKQCAEVKGCYEAFRKPSGLLNVIAHGDFNRKNMMFKYGSSGEPLEVILFDLGTIAYCSPSIDTSYFLFLNTSPEVRRLHWDEFIQTYYHSLSKGLDGHPAKPSFNDVELDLRKRGLHGYRVCSFALPLSMEFKTKEDWENSFGTDKLEQSAKGTEGANVTEYLVELVKHMLDKNFIFED